MRPRYDQPLSLLKLPGGMFLPLTALAVAGVALLLHLQDAGETACGDGLKEAVRSELYFGRSISGGGTVSDAEFSAFAASDIAPRLQPGFTLADASGAWASGGTLQTEQTKLLIWLHDGGAASSAALDQIAAAYKARFRQQAVLRSDSPACMGQR